MVTGALSIGAGIGTWQNYTPTLTAATTNPVLSNNASHLYEGRYLQIGKLVVFRAQIQAGTAGVTAGEGTYSFAMPVTARLPSSAPASGGFMIGQFAYYDSSTGTNYGGGVLGDFSGSNANIMNLAFASTTGAVGAAILVNHTNPFALAASDEFELWGSYEAA